MLPSRRAFVTRSAAAAASLTATPIAAPNLFAARVRPPKILLRSSWQTVNIGDIAHTPGVLHILEQHLPDAEIFLFPSRLDNGVDEILQRRFPKLRIVQRGTPELDRAFEECDFLLHSSGASLVAERDLVTWREKTGKPYGVYGITLPPKKSSATQATSAEALHRTVDVLSGASFVFFRDSVSLEFAKSLGVRSPIMQFGPDGAFACDLKDESAASQFLEKNNLEAGKFLCCIPRLRYTPYWTIKENVDFDPVKHARNEELKEHDHAPLREAIESVIEQTDLKILVCPEDRTQMQVGKEMIVDRLPSSVRKRVVWRENYWLTGEAISTYTRSAGLFGNEMHSPIMCIGHGVPAIVCRFAEQTSKGMMWKDIGLQHWLFDLDDETQVARIASAVLNLAQNPEEAREKAKQAKRFVESKQAETMQHLKNVLN